MDTERWNRIQDLFLAVHAMSDDERGEYFNRVCDHDTEMKREVLSLLDADKKATRFLNPPEHITHPEANIKPGTKIGPYHIDFLIGEGGMGAVYKAKDIRLQRAVALKFLSLKHQRKTASKDRFLVEARAASRLDHSNICTIYDIGETASGQPYIAMGYYPGKNLDMLLNQQQLTLSQCLEIITQVLNGVYAAHQQGIYHRDLKPANIILTNNNIVKILDFGIAKILGVDITTTGNQMGTIAYMSPEQIQGKQATQQSDIWSCGVIFYELLTGQRPFKGKQNHEIMYSITNRSAISLREHNSELPDAFQQIIDRMLCHDLNLRYPSAASVLNEIKKVGQSVSNVNLEALSSESVIEADTVLNQLHENDSTTTAFSSDGDLRQATVMSIDLCGFARLLETEGLQKCQKIVQSFAEQMNNIVESYGGKINRKIDNTVIAIFGVPVAHGNDAERAVRAAFSCHEAVKSIGEEFGLDLSAHIGIANGVILMNHLTDNPSQEFSITGDSLSLATRLDDIAQTNETIISDSLFSIVNHLFQCEKTGSVNVRNQQQPISVWRVIDYHPDDTNSQHAFVGRRSELQQFKNLLSDCLKIQHGQVVYVCGEAGIGKTRLSDEFSKIANEYAFSCHSTLILDFGVAEGEDAITSIIRSLLSLTATSSQIEIETVIKNLAGDNRICSNQEIYLKQLLAIPLSDEQKLVFDIMDHSARMQGIHDIATQIIIQKAEQTPLFILIEDLHWADNNTLDCIASIAAGIHHVPVILLLTTRPQNEPLSPTWRSKMQNTPLISFYLAALHEQEAIKMVRSFVHVDETGQRAIIERAEGNPLFLEQLVRNVGGVNETSKLPATLQSLVQSKLDKLPLNDRHAARAASIIGQCFSAELLCYLLDDTDYDCHHLVQHQIAHIHNNNYLFNHALIQEGVYASILVNHKQELHLRAADWFADRDKTLHAEHLSRANSPDAALAYLHAAEEQKQMYHYDKARRLIECAMQITTSEDLQFSLTILLGDVFSDIGSISEAAQAYKDSLKYANTDAQRSSAWIGLAQCYDVNDQYDDALRTLDKAEVAARNEQLTHELAQIHYQRGNLYFPRGDIQSCRNEHQAALRYAQEADSPKHQAQAFSGLGDAEYAAGHMIRAHKYFQRCLELCNQFGYARIEAANRFMLGTVRIYLNELEEALKDSLDSAQAATQVGHVRAEIVSRLTAAWILIDQMQLDQAMQQVERGLQLTERLGAKRFEPFLNESKARILIATGDKLQALNIAEQAMQNTRETGLQFIGPWILGTIALATNDPKQRDMSLAEGIMLLQEGCVGHNYYQFYRAAIEVSLISQDWEASAQYAKLFEEYTRQEPNPWADFHIQWGRLLSEAGKFPKTPNLGDQLQSLKKQAQQTGFIARIPLIDQSIEKLNFVPTTQKK